MGLTTRTTSRSLSSSTGRTGAMAAMAANTPRCDRRTPTSTSLVWTCTIPHSRIVPVIGTLRDSCAARKHFYQMPTVAELATILARGRRWFRLPRSTSPTPGVISPTRAPRWSTRTVIMGIPTSSRSCGRTTRRDAGSSRRSGRTGTASQTCKSHVMSSIVAGVSGPAGLCRSEPVGVIGQMVRSSCRRRRRCRRLLPYRCGVLSCDEAREPSGRSREARQSPGHRG
jgi:hypothetical protein